MRRAFLFLFAGLLIALPLHAQEEYAVPMEITFDTVDIQRVNTEQQIALSAGAVAPVGVGDVLRTSRDGRAFISFGDDSFIFLLPGTTYTIESIVVDDEGFNVVGNLNGVAILRMSHDVRLQTQARDTRIVDGNGLVGIWSDNLSDDVITVAEGQISVDAEGETYPVAENEGLRYRPNDVAVMAFDGNLNRARLIGEVDGCTAPVNVIEQYDGVLVRQGAGTNFPRRGLIRDGDIATLLAQTETSGWVRVQYKTSFGWSIAIAMETQCDLPTLPDDAAEEDFLSVINPTEDELSLLRPFFGDPRFDGVFFRYREEE